MEVLASELYSKSILNLRKPAPLLEHLVVAVEDTVYTDDNREAPFPLLSMESFRA